MTTVTLNPYPISQVFTDYRNTIAQYTDVNGVLQDAPINSLLVSYDASKNYKGIACRQQGVNLHSNPRWLGALAGSPGTDPTGMSLSFTNGTCTKSIVGAGIDANGMDYVDVQFAGTPNGAGPIFLYLDGLEAAAPNTQYAFSLGYKLVAGSATGIQGMQLGLQTYNASQTLEATTFTSASTLTPTSSLQRASQSATGDANTAYVRPVLRLQFLSSNWVAVNCTLRLYLPQVEKGAAFTTFMRPAAGAFGPFTRGADNILESLQTGALNATANTLTIECTIPQAASAGQDQGIWRLDDGTDANKFVIVNPGGGLDVQGQLTIGGTQVAVVDLGSYAVNSTFRAIVGYDLTAGTLAGLISGGNPTSASFTPPGSPPTFTRSLPGRSSLNAGDPVAQSARHLNGHIGRAYLCGGFLDQGSMLYLSQMQDTLGVLLTASGVTLASI